MAEEEEEEMEGKGSSLPVFGCYKATAAFFTEEGR